MLVSWLQRLSLLDYPGKVACVVFTLGCNLRCGFCQNSEFVLPEKIAHIKDGLKQTEEFFDFLKIRQWILDWVSVCGGEPTIHTDLPNFLTRIKSLGFKVKLDTNGRNPKMLQELISRGLVDYVAMDIKHTWGKYASIVGKNEDIAPYKESVRIIMQQAPEYEFRTTVIGGRHSVNDIEEIARSIDGAKHYYLQPYRSGDVLDSDFLGKPPHISELEAMKKGVLPYVQECIIRE